MIRFVLGVFLSAVVLFFWGYVFWVVSLIPYYGLQGLERDREDAIVAAFRQNLTQSGVYLIPWMPPEEGGTGPAAEKAMEEMVRRHKVGPICQIVYRQDGLDPMASEVFATGFLHMLVSSAIMAILLRMASPNLASYLSRAGFVFLVGLFAAVAVCLQDPIWFHHPWPYPLVDALYNASSWLLAGLVLALFIRPQTVPATASK